MDEIKSIISQLPPEDIAILKALYSPEDAKSSLSQEGQRMIPIIDGLSAEEQQDVVSVDVMPLGEPEGGDVNVDVAMSSEMPMAPEAPADMGEVLAGGDMTPSEEDKKDLGSIEDYLI